MWKAVLQLSLQPEQRETRVLGDFPGVPEAIRKCQFGCWVRGKLVKLSGLQGHVYVSDFMAINLPSTSVLTNRKMY